MLCIGELEQDFETIKTNLERGMLLQINIEIQECQTGPIPFRDDLVSVYVAKMFAD